MPKLVSIPFPTDGVVKRIGYQEQPTRTCPNALNVRSDDSLLGRERGGSRPGIESAWSTDIGTEVRLIADVQYVSSGSVLTKVVAIGATNSMYYGTATSGTLTSAGLGGRTFPNRRLSACDYLQKLYIASTSSGTAGVIIFDPSTNGVSTLTSSPGTAPTTCTLIANWRDRIVLAGPDHIWYMSRSGDPLDWDYAATDAAAAVSATSSTTAGRMGEPITALIPHNDQCLIFGCTSSIFILRGDPADGGTLEQISSEVGIIDQGSFCYDPEGYLYMLTNDGVYVMAPGCGSTPASCSREVLPQELVRVNPATHTVSMSYDFLNRGINLFVSSNLAGSSTHWWLDIKTTNNNDQGGRKIAFWPEEYQSTHEAFFTHVIRNYSPTETKIAPVLLGGRDGVIRQFNGTLGQDSGSEITSWIDYAAMPLGGPGEMGVLRQLQVTTAANSGDVDCKIRVGETCETAFNASTAATYEFNTAGVNPTQYPCLRGNAMVLRLENGQLNSRWALEELLVAVEPGGKRRYA